MTGSGQLVLFLENQVVVQENIIGSAVHREDKIRAPASDGSHLYFVNLVQMDGLGLEKVDRRKDAGTRISTLVEAVDVY